MRFSTMEDGGTATKQKIDEMVRRIVARFDPDRIILFGSHARGTGDPEGDVDLLVIMPVEGSRRRVATEIDLALVGVDMAADIVVVTPNDVERNKDIPGTIIRPALREGKVLYERKG